MNIYCIIILVALVGQYLLELVASLLNLRALDPELPREFQDVQGEPMGRPGKPRHCRTARGVALATKAH